MTYDILRSKRFENAKNEIRKLSQDVPNISLQEFKTEAAIFSWNDHNITGSEINELLVSPLQDTLFKQNEILSKLFNISEEVYYAIDYLDQDYIQALKSAVKSAEIASDQAKDASQQAFEASTKATTAQDDIKKTVKALELTVATLKDFAEKVNRTTAHINSDIEN